MGDVYLFGAGASRGYSSSSTGVSPPLAMDYFSTFNKLAISADLEVRIGNIVNYVRDTRGIPLEKQPTDFDENIESIFAEVDAELKMAFDDNSKDLKPQDIAENYGLIKTYDQFVFWFSHVLNEVQNGTPCPIYSELIKQLNPDDTLITFNWDTIIDRALYETGKWYPDDGYGIQFDGCLDGEWRDPMQSKSQNLLLKLHGSTNWFGPYVSRHLQTGARSWAGVEESVYKNWCLIDGSKWFSTYKNRWRPGYDKFSYFFAPNDPLSDLPLMPILIPPKEEKDFSEYAPIFNAVWSASREALSRANKLIIIGYSFPKTDQHAFSLLDNYIQSNLNPEIDIVDPYPEAILERIQAHVGNHVQITVHSKTLSEYLCLPELTSDPSQTEYEKIFETQASTESEPTEKEFREDFLLENLIKCNLSKSYFDISTYDGKRYLNCKIEGEFATHLYGAYKQEVRDYRLSNIPLTLSNGEVVTIALSEIWIYIRVGLEMLSEQQIQFADTSDMPESLRNMIADGFYCQPDELEWFLKRFVACDGD